MALPPSQAQQMLPQALALWANQTSFGLPQDIQVSVADLPAGELGEAFGVQIVLDVNANGAGWYAGYAAPDANRVDLLTALSHEVGHLFGYEHSDDAQDLMAATLPLGTRRLPGMGQVASQPALLGPLSLSASAASAAAPHSLLASAGPVPLRQLLTRPLSPLGTC